MQGPSQQLEEQKRGKEEEEEEKSRAQPVICVNLPSPALFLGGLDVVGALALEGVGGLAGRQA